MSSRSWISMPPIFARLRTSQMSMPCLLAVLMMQFWTYFWRFRQCQLNFMTFASALHAAVAFSRAILSALDNFAARAGVGMNATLVPSTAATMPAIKVVAKRYMTPSLERYAAYVAVEIGADSQSGGPMRPSYHVRIRTSSQVRAGDANRMAARMGNGGSNMPTPLIPDIAVFQRKLATLPLVTYQAGETVLSAAST